MTLQLGDPGLAGLEVLAADRPVTPSSSAATTGNWGDGSARASAEGV